MRKIEVLKNVYECHTRNNGIALSQFQNSLDEVPQPIHVQRLRDHSLDLHLDVHIWRHGGEHERIVNFGALQEVAALVQILPQLLQRPLQGQTLNDEVVGVEKAIPEAEPPVVGHPFELVQGRSRAREPARRAAVIRRSLRAENNRSEVRDLSIENLRPRTPYRDADLKS